MYSFRNEIGFFRELSMLECLVAASSVKNQRVGNVLLKESRKVVKKDDI